MTRARNKTTPLISAAKICISMEGLLGTRYVVVTIKSIIHTPLRNGLKTDERVSQFQEKN
jgi:hypothetical protein